MAFNLSKFTRMGEFTMETITLGKVHCVSLKTIHLSQADKKLTAASVQSLDVVRWLFGDMARRPVDSATDDHDPDNDPRFTLEELAPVTNAELEDFAGKLVQRNGGLLLKTHKGSDIHRTLDESACDFLARAFRHYAAEEEAQWKRMTDSITGSFSASAMAAEMGQSVLAVIAEADRHAISNSTMTSIGEILNRDQYSKLIGTTAPMHGYAVSIGESMRLKHEQELLRSDTLLRGVLHLDNASASSMLARAIYGNEALAHETALGLFTRESAADFFAASLLPQQQEILALRKSHDAMFRLPTAFEAHQLLESNQSGYISAYAQQQANETLDRQRFLESITTPWLHSAEAAASVAGMLDLQSMGTALRTMKGFDLELTAALRIDLGDWRDKIIFPKPVFIDPVARTDFYAARGFNPALTDFPEPAFEQSLQIAGLDGDVLDLDMFGPVIEPSTDHEEEAGLRRTNKCHDQLQRFERRLRQFINDVMTAQYGPDWPRKKLDPTLYAKWVEKKKRAENGGIVLSFIEVADFTDYETIICKQDHWREIFEPLFKKKESVRESLQRLYPIRVAAMHARIVTKEDQVYLFAEILRVCSAIK